MLFNLYYININKVYEISMMINNVVLKTVTRENAASIQEQLNSSSDFSMDFLGRVKSGINSSASSTATASSKVVENIELITTKSLLLHKILGKTRITNSFSEVNEGDLIRIDGVRLQLENELEVRQVKMVANGALKGLTYEGMEFGNLFNSILRDYSYVLTGKLSEENVLIKVPMQFENEFENLYNIDDLLIGSVSIVGIYKDRIRRSEIKSTFSVIKESGQGMPPTNIERSENMGPSEQPAPNPDGDLQYGFIDVIAIVQELYRNEEVKPRKVSWWKRFGSWLVNLFRRS